jgi:hypothetical protein
MRTSFSVSATGEFPIAAIASDALFPALGDSKVAALLLELGLSQEIGSRNCIKFLLVTLL